MEAPRASAAAHPLDSRKTVGRQAHLRVDRKRPAAAPEEALAEEIRKHRETWLEENREAIETYNDFVSRSGVFSDGLRGF
jgi:post-segregation antitoxin (ccd killing protein)